MAEFGGRLGSHIVVRERGLTVMLVSRTGISRTFWVNKDALRCLVQQHGQAARVCFTMSHGRDLIELSPDQLPRPNRRSGDLLGFSLSALRDATPQQLRLL